MNYKIVYYKDISKDQWDGWVNQVGETSYFHSWNLLNNITKYPGIKENASFALLDDANNILAVCPLAITFLEGKFYNMSFGHFPCPAPALVVVKPSQRRKTLDYIFTIIHSYAKKYDVKKIDMIWYPINRLSFSGSLSSQQNCFELMRYNMQFYIDNMYIIDLFFPEETLISNLSRYHYRHIKRGRKKGIEIKIYNNKHNPDELKKYFNKLQEAHFLSAGRMTRPQETWDAMYEGARGGEASVFVAFVKGIPISYLYCGEFGLTAAGWSQVNIEEYEKKYSPRHLLEWEAIIYYKNNGFRYYDIGERYFGKQLFSIPNQKEISISIFKERYGGFLLPKILWVGYFDNKFMEEDLDKHFAELKKSDSLFEIPEKLNL